MAELIQPDIVLPEVEQDDRRIGHLLGSNLKDNEAPRAVILGFPSDEGVARNGGRPGASKAPDRIREALYKMTPDPEHIGSFQALLGKTRDLGNLSVTGDVENDQQALGEVLNPHLQRGSLPIILGGGHETAFAHFLGYAAAELETAILNLDAHTDVRPLINGKPHSGSPFRQALEHSSGCCKQYLVAGLQPHSAAKAHLDYIESKGGTAVFRDGTNITSFSGLLHEHNAERLMMTFDMDAVDQAYAPGVSAPCSNGLHPDLWLTCAFLAGKKENVTSFDLSEVNPEYDRDGQTARLAALTVWHFLLGLSRREKQR